MPTPALLVALIAAGGAGVLVVPLVDSWVLEQVVAWDPGPRLDPLLAAVLLFGVPSVALAAVSPVAVRLASHSLARVGRTAGRLFAVSTAGSIAGTFATAFWLVPELGTSQLLAILAGALFVAVGVVALTQRLPLLVVAAAAAAAVVAAGIADRQAPDTGRRLTAAESQNWSPLYRTRGWDYYDRRDPATRLPLEGAKVVYARDTRYHRLAIVDQGDTRYLRFDASLQAAMYLDDPFRTRFRYTDYFDLGLAYDPSARSILFVGLGAGSAPKRVRRDFPNLQVDVVELDPEVVEAAHRFFRVPRDDPRMRIAVEDGRRFLAKSDRRYDVIAIDAFFADAIPFHLVTREFLELALSRLNPGGVIVTNAIGAIAGPGSRLFRSIYRTYRSVFPTVLVHPVILPGDSGDRSYRNLILVATERAAPATTLLAERWRDVRRRVPSAPDLERPILDRHDAPIPTRDVPLLTDDYAPTDALLLLFQ